MSGARVVTDGIPVDVPALRRSHIGFVFQKPNLIPFLDARRNVEIACEIGGRYEPRARRRAARLPRRGSPRGVVSEHDVRR